MAVIANSNSSSAVPNDVRRIMTVSSMGGGSEHSNNLGRRLHEPALTCFYSQGVTAAPVDRGA